MSRKSLSRLENIDRVDGAHPDAVEVVALGEPVRGLSVSLLHEDGTKINEDLKCGEVIVNGDSVTAGWVKEGGVIDPFPVDGLHTGDIGFFEDGELFVVERIKNIIIRNGQNYSALVLEQAIAELIDADIDNVLVLDRDIESGTGLTAVIELEKGVAPDAFLEAIVNNADHFEPPLDSVIFAKRGSLPRTTSGKKRHMAVRTLLNEGKLSSVAEHDVIPAFASANARAMALDLAAMQREDTITVNLDENEGRLLALISADVRARGVEVPVLLASRLQYDLDFDSLGLLDLAMKVEDEFDIELHREDIAEVKTARDLLDIVSKALQGDPGREDAGIRKTYEKLRAQVPQKYTTVDDVRPNREALINGKWMSDFATCNYLGLDEDPVAYEAIRALQDKWGMQRCWTRAVASPKPMIELEERLSTLVGVPDVMVFPTVTLLHFGVLPLLAGNDGAIIIDTAAHKSMHEAAALARAKGASVTPFKHRNVADLETKLKRMSKKSKRIIVLDGVYSMTGQPVDVKKYQELAEKYDATLYIDDAHGFGVLGENPTEESPLGHRGNGVVQHAGCTYDRIIYVGGLSKAFSTMAAFITCPTPEIRQLFEMASTMIFVHSVPIATLAQAHAALDANEQRGDVIRERLRQLTDRLTNGARDLGFEVSATSFPIVNVILGDLDSSLLAINTLWDDKVLLTPAIFPAAPLERGGLRLTITASNTVEQIDQVISSLSRLAAIRSSQQELDLTKSAVRV